MDKTLSTRILIAELIGTAVLIMGGPGSAIIAGDVIGIYGVSIAFGLSLLIMAYAIGPISGCHINPAVSLALLVKKKITNGHAISAVIGQIIGSILGAAIIFVIVQSSDTITRGTFAANQFGTENGFAAMGAAMIVEVVFTALLVYVVLATTTRKFAPAMGGLVAGLTLALIHLVTIPIDNTSVNPVRSLATAIFAETPAGGTAPISQIWLFIVFPLIGAVIGAGLWSLSNADDES